MKRIVGSKILKVFFNEDYLKFETDRGNFVYRVNGDCCSRSFFYDFIGVKKLLENGKVLDVKEVDLHPTDIVKGVSYEKDKKDEDSSIQVYGYQITTENEKFGKMTSVVSFRNYSNGYYGGNLEVETDRDVFPEIFDDILESSENKNV